MALMPEDLMNQRFTPVRFSEGYDMDEVDNFLDNEVEPRLKELISENERLKKELEEAKAKEIERVQKKHAGIKAKLENKLAQLAKIQDEVNELQAELDQARNEMPIVTDGVGDVPQPEPEVDGEDDEVDETDEAETPAEA